MESYELYELYDAIKKYENKSYEALQECEKFKAVDDLEKSSECWDRFEENNQLAKWLQQLYDIQKITEHYKNVNPEAFLKICEMMNKEK
jgi:hypothetical protein